METTQEKVKVPRFKKESKKVVDENSGRVFLGQQTKKFYRITGKDTVKRVGAIEDGFIANMDEEPLPENIEHRNTKILSEFLKRHLDDVSFKRGYVYYKGYKVCYSSHGFEVRDSLNYGTSQNANEWNNDIPTPEDVLAFLQKNADRSILPPPQTTGISDTGEALTNAFKVSIAEKTIPKNVTPVKPELSIKVALKKVDKILLNFKSKKFDHYEMRKALIDISTIHIKFKIDKLCNKYRKRAIRFKAFETQLLAYFNSKDTPTPTGDNSPKKQPRFKALPFEDCYNVLVSGGTVSYELDGPSGKVSKRVQKSEPLHLFRVREVLSELPLAMTYLMKVAEGKLTAKDIDEEHFSGKYVRDVFQPWDEKIVRNSTHTQELIEACDDFLRYAQIPSVLHRKQTPFLCVGDRVEITTYGFGVLSCFAKVLSVDSGLKVMYEDSGEIYYIMKWEHITNHFPKVKV